MKEVFLYAHTHWDREWYREFEEFRLRLIEVVKDILKKLKSGELPCFYFDGQTAALEDYLEIYPEDEKIIKKFIKEKKLFIGPFYCSADSLLCSSEFLLRNLSMGIKYSKEFGCNEFIGYLADTFGHSVAMSEILSSFGIKKAMLWRGLGTAPSEFIWKDICVTYLIQGYFQDFFSINASYEKKAEFIEKYLDKIAERSSSKILLPCGADHLKVADNILEQIKQINKYLKNYIIKFSNPFEYLNEVKNNYKSSINTEFLDQTKNFLLKGVYSSRIYQKQLNAKCQWELSRIAEPLATLCTLNSISENRQKEINYAYKNTIKNHAHDSIYGCSTDQVHEDVQRRFERTLQITNGITQRALRDLTEDTSNLRFINLSNYPYSGLVEFETEKTLPKKYNTQLIGTKKAFPNKKLFDPTQIPITEDITTIKKYLIEVENLPPFCINEGKINTKRQHSITEKSIENDYIALKIKNKKIELLDKSTNTTYTDFIEIIDRADIGDSYTFGALKNDKGIKAKFISSKIKKKGKLRSTLELIYEVNIPKTSSIKTLKRSTTTLKHKIKIHVSLGNLENYLSFRTEWFNKAQNHILQVRFNLKEPITQTISEDTLGLIERTFDADYDIYKSLPAPRGIELKTNTAPMQRFVWCQGLGIITKGLNEYEVSKNTISITLLRSTGIISEPHNPTRGTPAGPPIHCPKLQCLGENKTEFCIRFTNTPANLFQTAEAFYGSILTFFGTKTIDAPFEIKTKNILLQALKLSESNELIARFVNVSDKTEKLYVSSKYFKNIHICNSLEEEISEFKNECMIESGNIITLKFLK